MNLCEVQPSDSELLEVVGNVGEVKDHGLVFSQVELPLTCPTLLSV